MNTIFIKWDGSRILCPNAKLSVDMLTNVTRSQKKGETFKVGDSMYTSAVVSMHADSIHPFG